MKILILSDSHSSLSFMRQCIRKFRPEHVIHLGDHIDDGRAMAEENPHIRFHLLPGNCDSSLIERDQPRVFCYPVGGVKLFMTHGHLHGVKSGTDRLIAEAKKAGAAAALYGHTHQAVCVQEDGFWLVNPGSCRGYDGSCCLMETANEKITACRIFRQTDLDEWDGSGL